ncbi:hypothetical protein [Candidatus Williamhamiltonella defendens]|uniref:hypothetical protein n=1 Tax=Candidatus Williamhamiltonella defendens TaxID=138072 RepID=UPI0013E0B098|nr:hypothetical protein [Candidatus Hamiltonella defensa]
MPNRFMPTTGRWSVVTGEHRERGESRVAGTLRRPHAKRRGHGRPAFSRGSSRAPAVSHR